MVETDLHGMEWPAQSPDLHIIENVWHRIKHELQNMFKTSPHVSCWKLLFATDGLKYPFIIFKTVINQFSSI